MSTKIENFVMGLYNSGTPSSKIIAHLMLEHNMSGNKARNTWNAIRDKKGLSNNTASSGDTSKLIAFLIANKVSDFESRDDFNEAAAEESGYTKSTCNHVLSLMKFMDEYHKQLSK